MTLKCSKLYYSVVVCGQLLLGCYHADANPYEWKTISVTATAYNSLAYQTNTTPEITAFGDSLKPGLKYIAVSRDLLFKGLTHNTLVRIEGLDGVYLVKDKMNKRFLNRIDLYMGTDVNGAMQWGKKHINISYRTKIKIEKDSITPANN
jgi:3D (Asp-Asp-Asp) domain-containing protein